MLAGTPAWLAADRDGRGAELPRQRSRAGAPGRATPREEGLGTKRDPSPVGGAPSPMTSEERKEGCPREAPPRLQTPLGSPVRATLQTRSPAPPPGLLPSFPPPTPTHPQAPRTPPAHAWPGVLTQPSLQSSTPPCSMLRGHRREIEAWSLCPRPPPVSGCAQGLLPKPGTWSCACRSGCRPLGRGPCPRRAPAHPSAGWGNTSPLGWRP